MIIEKKQLSELRPAPYNARQSSKAQEKQLQASLQKFGVVEPIIFNKQTGYVVGGHFRLRELTKMGYKEVECVIVDLSEDDEKELNIRLNANTGSWDWDGLANNFDANDLTDWGLDIPDFKTDEELEAKEDAFDTTPPEIPITVLGDLYEIGEHRLLCGDSTDSDQVAKLMNGQKSDISFTSPPYNAAKNSHLNGRVKGFDEKYQQKNDSKTDEEYLKFLYDFTINTTTFSTYSFVNIQLLAQNKFVLIDYQNELKHLLKDILIWNKSQCPPNIVKGAFNTKWEYVFCFSENNETRGFPTSWQGKYPNVIETENASGNEYADIHKATFPISFPSWIIEKMDFANSVLDLFCGTGTTMVAAHQLKRKCYGMELDPKYCDVIVNRMKSLDPDIEIKLNGKPFEKAY